MWDITSATAKMVLAILVGVGTVVSLVGCAQLSGEGADRESPDADAFVIDQDFPDPDIVKVGQTYYAYATNAAGINVQSATSSDLTHWNVSSADVLPQLPAWALPGKTWAPDVSEVSPGHFVLYFVAASADPPLQCIGVATSASAGGPFVPVGDLPMVCQEHEGGSIDPSSFVDEDGTRYLLWKNDGNCCGLDTWLQLAQLSPDGQRLEGPTTKLIKQTEGWEGNVVEAPILRRHGEKYVLFYSANDYSGGKYAIGYARASAITGPYTKHKGPLFSTELSHDRYLGPGGQDVVIAPGGTDHIVFHSWSLTDDFRGMNVLPLTWHGDRPEVIMPER
jgi:arabinan endo-1,5-alpha-L-arabinosidase